MIINECAMYIAIILNRDIYIKVFIGMVNLIVNNILYLSDKRHIYLMTYLRHIKQLIVAEYVQLKSYSSQLTLQLQLWKQIRY